MLKTRNIRRILIANRGEIAKRILCTTQKLGIESVVASTLEEGMPTYANQAHQTVTLKGNTMIETWLNIDQWIEIAQQTACDAIHPGYGFLSENTDFALACEKAGIVFIGPGSELIRMMGNKQNAREFIRKLGIPVPEAIFVSSLEETNQFHSFPAILKAPSGGGGKGMIQVENRTELQRIFANSFAEIQRYSNDKQIILEQLIENARHIEVQILADVHGNIVHLFERECSVQRRHQKIIEEAPASILCNESRKKITDFAIEIIRKSGYYNAGTVEFLMDINKNFYFLEMNTRIQVEHPVTEMITGIDIIEQQIRIAENKVLPFSQSDIRKNGHAIEVRLCAENPKLDFAPTPGIIEFAKFPKLSGLRIETFLDGKTLILPDYDSMLAKLIVWGNDRPEALQKMERTLNESTILGIETNLTYLLEILKHEDFAANNISTQWQKQNHQNILQAIENEFNSIAKKPEVVAAFAMLFYFGLNERQSQKNLPTKGRWRLSPEVNFHFQQKKIRSIIHEKPPNSWTIITNLFTIELKNFDIQKKMTTFEYQNYRHIFFWSVETPFIVNLSIQNHFFKAKNPVLKYLQRKSSNKQNNFQKDLQSPLYGRIVDIMVNKGNRIHKGEVLLVIESMKMENQITAAFDASIGEILVEQGAKIIPGQPLLTFTNILNTYN